MADTLDQRFSDLLGLVGRLNYTWTNTESLLIHLIAGLARTDTETALVIFLTLNTTRARVELVKRLAKLERAEPELRSRILAAMRDMMRHSALRNRYNHCIYSFDQDSGTARTILMRIADRQDELKIGQMSDIDDRAIAQIEEAIAKLDEANRTIWQIVLDYDFPT
jgi:hypothetical protein